MTRVVFFKQEGKIDGEPFGPAKAVTIDPCACPILPPFNPLEVEWVELSTAQEMADMLGLELRKDFD